MYDGLDLLFEKKNGNSPLILGVPTTIQTGASFACRSVFAAVEKSAKPPPVRGQQTSSGSPEVSRLNLLHRVSDDLDLKNLARKKQSKFPGLCQV